MSITRFYLLCEPEGNQCIADMNEAAPYSVEKIPCPIERGHARGRRNSPLDMVVPCDPAPDVVFTWMSECLIQESVRLIFESEGLTGFSTLPARAKIKKTGASIPVHELVVTGWGGMVSQHGGIAPATRRRSVLTLMLAEREGISRGIDSGSSIRAIAKALERAVSTVSREVAGHGGRPLYRANAADQQAWQSALRPKRCLLAVDSKLREIVASKLVLDWSPQQISGWLKTQYPETRACICPMKPFIAARSFKRAEC